LSFIAAQIRNYLRAALNELDITTSTFDLLSAADEEDREQQVQAQPDDGGAVAAVQEEEEDKQQGEEPHEILSIALIESIDRLIGHIIK
jgi:hypothetical protein